MCRSSHLALIEMALDLPRVDLVLHWEVEGVRMQRDG